MCTRDGFSSDEVLPFSLFSYQLTDYLPQSSAIDISVPSVDSAYLQQPFASNNYPNGYNPAFSMPLSYGRSDFLFRNPLSPQFTRPCSPDWLSLDHHRTNPGEIERSCQSPSLCDQFSEFEKGNQGHVKGSDDDGALDSSFSSKIKEARYVPTPTELSDEIDECLASHLEGPKDFNDEIARYWPQSSEISNKNKMQNEVGAEHANVEHAGDAMGSLGLGDNFKPDQIQGSQHEGDNHNSTVFGTNKEADEHEEAPILIRPRDLKIKDLSNSVDSCADDMAPVLASEGKESPKTQNQDGSDASESLSLIDDDTDLETLYSSDACDVSESTWDLEDNQEMQSGFCHTSGNELVSDDSDGSLSDWELV